MDAKKLLRKVKEDYAAIAEEFDTTRRTPWPEFEAFLKATKKLPHNKKIKLLDAGCGNGRLVDFLAQEKEISYLGIDNNRPLLRLAKKHHPKTRFRFSELTTLPFPPHSFDVVWCIAVLHHLPTRVLQKKALKEMKRVLKKNGLLIITVWNLWQPKYKKCIHKKTHHALVSWGNKKLVQRFYYAFTEKEIRTLLQESGIKKIRRLKSQHNFAYSVQ